MTQKKLTAAEILAELAKIRERLPEEMRRPRPTPEPTSRTKFPMSADAMADFEQEAIIEALQSLADDVHAGIEQKRAKMMEKALEIYYVAEELAKQPENAHLIPHVEEMQRAYKAEFGKPIPPKKKQEP
jgi:tRNA A37 N6-isopentenylltransferase MiaA